MVATIGAEGVRVKNRAWKIWRCNGIPIRDLSDTGANALLLEIWSDEQWELVVVVVSLLSWWPKKTFFGKHVKAFPLELQWFVSWEALSLSLSNTSELLLQVVFEAVVGTSYQGDIAIDDISFTSQCVVGGTIPGEYLTCVFFTYVINLTTEYLPKWWHYPVSSFPVFFGWNLDRCRCCNESSSLTSSRYLQKFRHRHSFNMLF